MADQQAIARDCVRHRMAVYNNAADRGQIEEILGCFCEDGILETSTRRLEGRGAMRAFYESVRDATHGGQSLRGSRHHLTTSRIEIGDADHASAWTYFLVVRSGAIIQSGIYIDTLIREGDDWRFSLRRVKLDFDG